MIDHLLSPHIGQPPRHISHIDRGRPQDTPTARRRKSMTAAPRTSSLTDYRGLDADSFHTG
jgi:hypothetical protein